MDELTDLNNSEDHNENGRALELKFSIGYNTSMTGAVLNLTLKDKKEIFYPSANTGVIYNYETCEQMLLQGHCNAITSVNSIYDADNNKRLIVTADSGKNAAIFIWNADTGAVESSIFRPDTDEVISIDFSKNYFFIAFLTHQKDEKGAVVLQRIYVYEWKPKAASEQIFYTEFGCEDGEIYYELKFNPNMEKVMEFLVTSPNKIFFSVINPVEHTHSRAYYPHPLDEKKITKDISTTFTQSIFLHNNQKGNTAITGTTGGFIIVWDVCEALCKEDEIKDDRRKIKTVDLLGKYKKDKDKDKKGSCSQKDHINILVNYENYIVIGSGGGTVNFYDYNFIIVRWFENVCWMVKSISFDMGYENLKGNAKYGIAEDNGNTSNFKCVPFITSDISGTITRVYNKQNDEIDYTDDSLKYEEIYRGFESDITSIAVHPKLNLIAIGTKGQPPENMIKINSERQKDSILKEKRFEYRACVQLLYYPNHMDSIKKENEKREKEEENRKKLQKLFKRDDKKNPKLNQITDDDNDKLNEEKYTNCYKKIFPVDTFPTVLEFSPSDNLLMVGTSFQKILPLNINNLSGPLPEKQTILQIKEIADKEDKNAEIKEIIFSPDKKHFAATDNLGRIGLFRSENGIWSLVARYHFKDNQIISFCFSEDGARIFTICEDRILQEFKVESDNQIYENYLLTKLHSLKIEDDCNMTSVVWSPLTSGKDRNILISNDEYKIRSVMVQGLDQLIITKTSLGPCYGGPIRAMKMLPGKDKEKRMISFITEEKIMGLMLLPVDGNPFRYMGVIAHPGNIKDMKPASNVNYIFTTGGNDYTINIWKYNINPLFDAVQQGGEGLDPFRSLLEDGNTGLRYEEMVDYFYYAQIKSKDENTTKHRTLTQTVPINLIHGLLASLGYYPSNEEILNIKNEVRYSKLNEKVDSVNFEGFVKLYLNHRPYIDLDVDKIEESFNNLAKQTKYHVEADRGENQDKIPEGSVTRESFLHMLKENGEKMDDKEIGDILQVLVGDPNPNHLPPLLSFNYIFESILLMEKEEKEVKK